jgi:hypothetical protein
MTDAAVAYLRGDEVFRSPAMLRAQALPDGVHRAAAR